MKLSRIENSPNIIVEMFDFNEFIEHAKKASLILYEPQFFSSPFHNDEKIRSVNCYALGVDLQTYPVILKYQKSRKNTHFRANTELKSPKEVIHTSMCAFIDELKRLFHIVRGTIQTDRKETLWHDLF